MRYITGLVILIAASMACSQGNDRIVAASPTSPTSAAAETTIAYVGGVSGPMDVLFPARNESFVFRNDLETKYATGLGRAAPGTFVDREGEIVWMQEYIRYRVNGCDHATAMARVAHADRRRRRRRHLLGAARGRRALPAAQRDVRCAPHARDHLSADGTRLELARRSTRKAAPSGSPSTCAIAPTRCDHATAEQNVFSQIDGGPVPPTCATACSYVLNPAGINSELARRARRRFEVRPATATSRAVHLDGDEHRAVADVRRHSVARHRLHAVHLQHRAEQRRRPHRVHRLRVAGRRARAYQVNQERDRRSRRRSRSSIRSARLGPTTECHFRSAATPCNFTATVNLPGGGAYTYNWSATYFYGTQKTVVLNSTSNVFTFTDACGGAGATVRWPAGRTVRHRDDHRQPGQYGHAAIGRGQSAPARRAAV